MRVHMTSYIKNISAVDCSVGVVIDPRSNLIVGELEATNCDIGLAEIEYPTVYLHKEFPDEFLALKESINKYQVLNKRKKKRIIVESDFYKIVSDQCGSNDALRITLIYLNDFG